MAIAGIVFACVFAGALLGMYLRTVLPDGHLSTDTKDVVKVAVALVATMAALILSLLISSAKSAYDTRNNQLLQISADIITIDRTLAHYGPDAKDVRSALRSTVAAGIERVWPTNGAHPAGFDLTISPVEALYDKIEELSPQTESQRALRTQALQTVPEIGRLR